MTALYPTAPRIFAGAGAVISGSYFAAAQPAVLLARGFPLTAYTLAGTTLVLVAFLALLAFFPAALHRMIAGVSQLDLRDSRHMAAALVMASMLYFVIGYGALVSGAFAFESEVVHGEAAAPIGGDELFVGLTINVIILVLPPLLYLTLAGASAPLAELGLRWEGAPRAALIGAASAIGIIVLIGVVTYLVQGYLVEIPENQRALDIARSVTVLGAVALAAGSSVSEEVFFRGLLQPRVGLWGQAVIFALAHLSYVNVLEVVVVFVLALAFGLIFRATKNLWGPIAGHFTFNLLMLLAGIAAPAGS